MNVYGRTIEHGKSVEKDMRSLISDDISSDCGDVSTGLYASSGRGARPLRLRYKVIGITFSKIWKTFCQNLLQKRCSIPRKSGDS